MLEMNLDGNAGITNSFWTSATRPNPPNPGQMGFNTTIGLLEAWDGTKWVSNAGGNATGTVTFVGGVGNVSGISLTGNISNAGNLTLSGALILTAPPAIGTTVPNTGSFTNLTAANGIFGNLTVLNGVQDSSGNFGTPGQVLSSTGNGTLWITANTGANILSSPPPIGNATPNTAAFTSLTIKGPLVDSVLNPGVPGQYLTSTGTGVYWETIDSLNLSSPPPIGDVVPNTGAFTTLTAANLLTVIGNLTDSTGNTGRAGQLLSSNGNGGVIWANSNTVGGLSSPPPIGNETPNTGSFTSLGINGPLFDSTGSKGSLTGNLLLPQMLGSTGNGIQWVNQYPGIGLNCEWVQYPKAQRWQNIRYTNNTEVPIMVYIIITGKSDLTSPGQDVGGRIWVDDPASGNVLFMTFGQTRGDFLDVALETFVPIGASYTVKWPNVTYMKASAWYELRPKANVVIKPTYISTWDAGYQPTDMIITPDNAMLYTIDSAGGRIYRYFLDLEAGFISGGANTLVGINPQKLAIRYDGTQLYCSSQWIADPATQEGSCQIATLLISEGTGSLFLDIYYFYQPWGFNMVMAPGTLSTMVLNLNNWPTNATPLTECVRMLNAPIDERPITFLSTIQTTNAAGQYQSNVSCFSRSGNNLYIVFENGGSPTIAWFNNDSNTGQVAYIGNVVLPTANASNAVMSPDDTQLYICNSTSISIWDVSETGNLTYANTVDAGVGNVIFDICASNDGTIVYSWGVIGDALGLTSWSRDFLNGTLKYTANITAPDSSGTGNSGVALITDNDDFIYTTSEAESKLFVFGSGK